jgi:hypothetical protein
MIYLLDLIGEPADQDERGVIVFDGILPEEVLDNIEVLPLTSAILGIKNTDPLPVLLFL